MPWPFLLHRVPVECAAFSTFLLGSRVFFFFCSASVFTSSPSKSWEKCIVSCLHSKRHLARSTFRTFSLGTAAGYYNQEYKTQTVFDFARQKASHRSFHFPLTSCSHLYGRNRKNSMLSERNCLIFRKQPAWPCNLTDVKHKKKGWTSGGKPVWTLGSSARVDSAAYQKKGLWNIGLLVWFLRFSCSPPGLPTDTLFRSHSLAYRSIWDVIWPGFRPTWLLYSPSWAEGARHCRLYRSWRILYIKHRSFVSWLVDSIHARIDNPDAIL